MSHRLIVDADGRTWQVWETKPGPRSKVSPGLEGGWITFELVGSPEAKRRLAPVPPGWESMAEHSLARLIEGAKPVAVRKRTITQVLEDDAAPPPPPPAP